MSTRSFFSQWRTISVPSWHFLLNHPVCIDILIFFYNTWRWIFWAETCSLYTILLYKKHNGTSFIKNDKTFAFFRLYNTRQQAVWSVVRALGINAALQHTPFRHSDTDTLRSKIQYWPCHSRLSEFYFMTFYILLVYHHQLRHLCSLYHSIFLSQRSESIGQTIEVSQSIKLSHWSHCYILQLTTFDVRLSST